MSGFFYILKNISYLVGWLSFVCHLLEFHIYECLLWNSANIVSICVFVCVFWEPESDSASERDKVDKCVRVCVCVCGTYHIQKYAYKPLVHTFTISNIIYVFSKRKKKKIIKTLFFSLYSSSIFVFRPKCFLSPRPPFAPVHTWLLLIKKTFLCVFQCERYEEKKLIPKAISYARHNKRKCVC